MATELPPTAAKPKFYGIDVIRGLATCMVALAHVAYRTGEASLGGQKAFGGALDGLFVCVDFFFVLSGFLIAWVHWKDIGRPSQLGRYAKRRLARIYPVYWIVLTLFIIGQFIQPSVSRPMEWTFKLLTTSYFIIPNDGPTLLGVAWTLYYEIIGYIVFAMMLLWGRYAVYAIIAWVVAIVAVNLVQQPSQFPLSFYLHPYHLQFLMGIGAAAFLKKVRLPMPGVVATIGGVLFIAGIFARVDLIFENSTLMMRVLMGASASMVIVGLIECERSRAFKIPQFLQTFGVASYSIYLVHTIVQAPTIKYGWPLWRLFPSEVWIFFVAAISIAIGYVFHRMVELPATEIVKRWILREDQDRKPIILTS